MWCNNPLAKEIRQQNEQWGWGLDATGKGGGWTKFEKGRGRQYRGGGLYKLGGLGPLCQLCCVTAPSMSQFTFHPTDKVSS